MPSVIDRLVDTLGDSSGRERYDRHARFEQLLMRIRHPFHPDFSFHRRLIPPPDWIKRQSAATRASDYVYALIRSEFPEEAISVLDAGCGFGGGVIWLGNNTPARVTGLTNSVVQADLATANVKRYCHGSATVRVGSYDQLGRKKFDVIFGVESIIHSPDLAVTISSIKRALDPGGLLIVIDDFWEQPQEQLSRELRELGWGMARGLVLDDFLFTVRENDFEVLKCIDLTARVKLILSWQARIIGTFLQLIPLRKGSFMASRRDFHLAQLIQHLAFHTGKTRYRMIVARCR